MMTAGAVVLESASIQGGPRGDSGNSGGTLALVVVLSLSLVSYSCLEVASHLPQSVNVPLTFQGT